MDYGGGDEDQEFPLKDISLVILEEPFNHRNIH